jgi:hypothetical protein
VLAAYIIALMMEATTTSETLLNFYKTTWRDNPEDSHLRTHRRQKLKSYENYFLASHYVPNSMKLNANQFSFKFLHLEGDMSDMQLRYHQLCSLASNIPSELRVAPRSTPERTSHFC